MLFVNYSFAIASSKLDSLENKLITQDSEVEKIKILFQIGEVVYPMNPDSADLVWNQGLQIAHTANQSNISADDLNRIRLYESDIINKLGLKYYEAGVVDLAEDFFLNSLELKQELKTDLGIGDVYYNLSKLQFDKANYYLSIENARVCKS